MKTKITLLLILIVATAFAAIADLAISNIKVLSGYPWKDVLIGYTITGSTDQPTALEVTAKDNEHCTTYECKTLEGADCTPGTHILKWKAQEDGAKFQSDKVVFTMRIISLGGVQLWENGPYWAECNVGASQPEEYGYYFWWGDTVGYRRDGGTWTDGYCYSGVTWVSSTGTRMSSSPFSSCPTYNKTTSQLKSAGYIDASGNLVAAHDAATAHLGAPWRMPTDAEWGALISNCDTEWTTRNGVSGHLVKGRGAYASKSIFLPAAGRGYDSNLDYTGSYGDYWSSTPDSDESYGAWYLSFSSGNFFRYSNCRYYGRSVRPLRVFAQ